jgi:hypothetical protein
MRSAIRLNAVGRIEDLTVIQVAPDQDDPSGQTLYSREKIAVSYFSPRELFATDYDEKAVPMRVGTAFSSCFPSRAFGP